MNQKNSPMDNDKLIHDRMTAGLIILAIVTALLSINLFNQNRYIHTLEDDISHKVSEKKKIVANNKKVDAQNEAEIKKMQMEDVKRESQFFNQKFFVWGSWKEFSDNMLALQKRYPNIEREGVVNLSETAIGSSKSPVSSYGAKRLITANTNEMGEIISQRKHYPTGESITTWYKISEYQNGQYRVKLMKTGTKY